MLFWFKTILGHYKNVLHIYICIDVLFITKLILIILIL